MLALRIEPRVNIFTEAARVEGPEAKNYRDGVALAPWIRWEASSRARAGLRERRQAPMAADQAVADREAAPQDATSAWLATRTSRLRSSPSRMP